MQKENIIDNLEAEVLRRVSEQQQLINKHGPARSPRIRLMPKIGRNAPCPCGSGKKFKRCCLPLKG